MGKIALLLLVAAGLIIFGVQNQTPIVLVVLGTQTLAVPLAIWVLGALAAGALTTLLLSGFFSLSKAGAVRRAGQRFSDVGSRSPWGGVGTKRGTSEASGTQPRNQANNTVGFRAASSERRNNEPNRRSTTDDWEQSDIDRETWNDWGEPEPAPRRPPQSTSRTNIRDTAAENWTRWDDNRPATERPTDPPTRRSESRESRSPVDQYQDMRDDLPERNAERNSGVYDAEYRVLVPPYSSQPAPQTPPPPPPKTTPIPEPDPLDDDDDWGFDDLDLKK